MNRAPLSRVMVSLRAVAYLSVCALASSPVWADSTARRFTYLYPTLTESAGEVEIENRVTYKQRPGSLREFQFRHEVEYGLTDRTQLSAVLGDWSYDVRERASRFGSFGLECIHNLSHPVRDWLGSALYGEASLGERSAAIEGKLLLEKRIGKWTVGWNGTVEAEWEGHHFGNLQTASGELNQSLGVAYDLTRRLSVGAELLHEVPLERWKAAGMLPLWVGPNVTYRRSHYFASLTTLFQTTQRVEEARLQTRLIVGIEF